MKNCITYDLRYKFHNSNEYYKFISDFASKVLQKIRVRTDNIIDDFMDYIVYSNVGKLRSREEYELEFLIIGVLWNVYIKKALNAPKVPCRILILLSSIRKYSWVFKSYIDNLRGKLSYKYLLINVDDQDRIYTSYSRNDFKKLIIWLKASGEFRYEVKRMNIWNSFFKNNDENYVSDIMDIAVKTAVWFEKESMKALGIYTSEVKSFLNNEYKFYETREDNIFCGRKEVEYHLNMVGAEILNKAFRNTFLKTNDKKVIIPACMCLKPYGVCRRKKVNEGFICMNCSEKCKVNILGKTGEQHNFKVYIVPHESDAFSNTKDIKYGDIGIVGIACVLNLIEGGLKARDLNLVPQCVILDYCGCKNHWHKCGIETDINYKKLFEVLGIK
ncbi:DUF116 domain-containing protein [Clostridium sp. WILCCON 0269]|uniref:DUF116 domain-containing protein n=1 Tax=Candidatus Clostridium eludens TaxID=3381663 RepID=A0ABW8SGR4_9CLOT